MRLLIEIVIAAALIGLGWEKSFHQTLKEAPIIGVYLGSTPAKASPATPRALPSNEPAPATGNTSATSALLDPNHRTVLDRPIDPPNKTFTGHILYKDELGKTYWLDAQGNRHYSP